MSISGWSAARCRRAPSASARSPASTADWLKDKKVSFLAQAGARRDKLLPDVPLLTELAKNEEQRKIFQLVSSAPAIGQPYVAPPGVPADRLAVLRKAFDATLA